MMPRWLKSSYTDNGNCVEVAPTLDRMRDSKDPVGPVLEVDVASFVRAVKSGRFDR